MVDFVTYGAAFWVCIGFNLLALLVVVRRIRRAERRASARCRSGRASRARAPEGAWRPGVAMLAVIVLFLTLGTSLHTPMIGAYTRDVLEVKMSYMALLFPLPAFAAGLALWKFGHLTDRLPRQVPLIAGMLVAATVHLLC